MRSNSAREAWAHRRSAVGHDPFAHEKGLQTEAAPFELRGGLDPDVAVVPGLPPVAALVPAGWVGEYETVLARVLRQPYRGARVTEAPFDLVGGRRVREVHGGAELVLAVSRRGAHRVGPCAVDALEPAVSDLLVSVGAEGRGHHQLLAVGRGGRYQVPQVPGRLAAEQHLAVAQRGDAVVRQGDEIIRYVFGGQRVGAVHEHPLVVAGLHRGGDERRLCLPRPLARHALVPSGGRGFTT